jgi:hypothetical protein
LVRNNNNNDNNIVYFFFCGTSCNVLGTKMSIAGKEYQRRTYNAPY